MCTYTETLDLASLRLGAGEGRSLECGVRVEPFLLGGDAYAVEPVEVPVMLQVSRTVGRGYALRLRFTVRLTGRCMRCLEPAAPSFEVDVREVSQPGAGEDLDSPYVDDGLLDLPGWAHDALALSLPASVLCRPDCAGLCPVCGENLNRAGPGHHHDSEPDARWAKLSELRFEP